MKERLCKCYVASLLLTFVAVLLLGWVLAHPSSHNFYSDKNSGEEVYVWENGPVMVMFWSVEDNEGFHQSICYELGEEPGPNCWWFRP